MDYIVHAYIRLQIGIVIVNTNTHFVEYCLMDTLKLGGTWWMGLTGIGILGLVVGQCVTGIGFIAAVVHSFTC